MVRSRDETDLVCPLRETTGGFESFLARGRNWILRQILEGRTSPSDFSETFRDRLYSCLLCGNCTEHCLVLEPESWTRFPKNRYTDHLINNDGITMALRNLVIEEGRPPVQIQNVLKNVERLGNPCRYCSYLEICRGGCRAVAAFVTGSTEVPDPECPFVVSY